MSEKNTPEKMTVGNTSENQLANKASIKNSPKKNFDIVRKLVGPIVLAASALSTNVAAQTSPSPQDTMKQAEQLGKIAEQELKRASELHMYQGVLLMTIGNFEEAKKMFQKALEIDPINKKAQEYLDRINKGAV